MNFSAWAIKKPIPVIILFICLTLSGLYAFKKISIKNFPDMDFPSVTVSVSSPGVTPVQLETQVTRKIENSLANIDLIKHITSVINGGSSVTTIEFDLNKDLQQAVEDVRNEVTKVKNQFPAGTKEPTVARVDIGGEAILTYQITGNMDIVDLSWFVDNTINKLLSGIPGVGKITRQGGVDREIQVLLSNDKLNALNATIDSLSSKLLSVRQDYSGGRANIGGSEQNIKIEEDISDAASLAKIIIPLSTGGYAKLSDIAEIRDTVAETRQAAFLAGKPILSFRVFPSKGASELAVAGKVRDAINEFNQTHKNVTITEISNSVSYIRDNYSSSMQALYEGCILAIIIVWLFLRDIRATFVSAIALPLSIIPTFLFMYLLDFSLNTISLLALTLVIGVLVDDAIVEVENIVRHIHLGKSPIKAAFEASSEIGMAVIATSLTLVAVFLPTAFMGGVIGRVFKQFGWTAAISVLMSLVVARLITPLMGAYLLKPAKVQESHKHGRIMLKYLSIISWTLANRKKTLLIVLSFFVLSLLLIFFVPSTFIPAGDDNRIIVNVTLQPGSTIKDTTQVLNLAYQQTHNTPGVVNVYSTIGTGVQSGDDISIDGDVTTGTIVYQLTDNHKRKNSQAQIEKIIYSKLKTIPGAKFYGGSSSAGQTYILVLASDDSKTLEETAKEVDKELRQLHGLGAINSDYNLTRPEVWIKPNFNRAAELGVTPYSIGEVVRIATSGDFSTNLAKIDLPDRQLPINVKMERAISQSIQGLSSLRVSGNKGPVPLYNVAELLIRNSPISLTHYDRSRSVTFTIDLNGGSVGDVDKKVSDLKIMKHLPISVHKVPSGDVEFLEEMISGFLLAMLSGVLSVYFILVILFNSFKHPLTILGALPLAISGALGSMILFGFSISMPTLIGILMLMGIVTKNSILLVDYILLTLRRGSTLESAILDACSKRSRPIIMTTLAMIAGMLPIALGLEGDSSFRSPMAVTVIGGLIVSTFLSLLVIPVLFASIDEGGFAKKSSKSFFKRLFVKSE